MIILNEARPRYEKLDELFEPILQNIKFSNTVSIVIDLKEICRKFYRPDIDIINQSSTIEEISADLINTIGHYRNYFYKKGKYTDFYVLYSFEKCNSIIEDVPEYKSEYYKEYFDEENPKYSIMKKAVLAASKVMNFLPKVNFIDTSKYDEFVYAKFISTLKMKNEALIILSNDDVFYQLVAPNIFILTMKGIKSEFIKEDNVIETLIGKQYEISSKSIPLVLAIGGTKRYSYKSLPNIALIKAANIVQKLIKEEKAVDADSVRIPLNYEKFDDKNKMEALILNNKDTIENNYYFIKADNILYEHKLDIKNDVFKEKRVICTSKALMDLNEKIFTRYPLNLDLLVKGEKIN